MNNIIHSMFRPGPCQQKKACLTTDHSDSANPGQLMANQQTLELCW